MFHHMSQRLRLLYSNDPGEFFFRGLFWSFWLTLAIFPSGYGTREVMPLVCLLFLAGYYRHARQRSVWGRLPVRALFFCLWTMILLGIVLSGNVFSSLLHAGTGINKGFILPLIAMECVRDLRDLRRLVWAGVMACLWQGLDGIWQWYSGYDFIMGYTLNSGRLTGSLGDYAVGNYIALALIPSFACWHLLRERFSAPAASLLLGMLLFPAFFLLVGASSRSGFLAVGASLCFWWVVARPPVSRRLLLILLGLLGLFVLAQQSRLGPSVVAGDGRWSLWRLGWAVFCQHPVFGAGAGQYNAAFRALGLVPERDAITISHPHNMYLDLLYAHGLVGFALGMLFLLGFALWGYRCIRPQLAGWAAGTPQRLYWQITGWFWCGYMGWLVNGIFGHDFYRTWWLGLAMCHLGVFAGAIVNGERCAAARHGTGGPQAPAVAPQGKADTAEPPESPWRERTR